MKNTIKKIRVANPVKRIAAIMLALGIMTSGAMAVFAQDYFLDDGDISVTADEGGQNYVTQPGANYYNHHPEDNEVVITRNNTNEPTQNTITVDAGTTVTLDNIYIDVNEGGNVGLTVTDEENKGEAATVIMKNAFIVQDWDSGRTDDTPSVVVKENAGLKLLVDDNYNVISGYLDSQGNSTPAILLEDGASLTIGGAEEEGYGCVELYSKTPIVSATGSFDDVAISLEGSPEVWGGNHDFHTVLEMIPDGTKTELVQIYDIDTYNATWINILNEYGDYETAEAALLEAIRNGKCTAAEILTTPIKKKESPAPAPANAEPVSAKAEPVSADGYATGGNFATNLVYFVGKYVPEINELKGGTSLNTFENFKEYVENNKLFDASGLTPSTKLTAGQIALVLCKAAGISVSGADDALAKLAEKGILTGYGADDLVLLSAAKSAMSKFAKEFLAD